MTKFDEIYQRAVFKFKDYSHLNLPTEIREELFLGLIRSAINDFTHSSNTSLGYSLVTEPSSGDEGEVSFYAFDNNLSEEEKEIITLGVIYHWLSGKAMNAELLKNVLHNKDYSTYSPANLLKEINNLRSALKQDFVGKINIYSFRNSPIGTLRPGG